MLLSLATGWKAAKEGVSKFVGALRSQEVCLGTWQLVG